MVVARNSSLLGNYSGSGSGGDAPPSSVTSGGTATVPPALMYLEDLALLQRTCLPATLAKASSSSLQRPPEVPGQQATVRLTGPCGRANCTNSTSASPMQQCYPGCGIYTDVAGYTADLEKLQQPVLNGYIVRLVNTYYICESFMTEACAQTYGGLVGCYYHMFGGSGLQPAAAALAGASPGSDSGNDGGGHGGGGGGGNSVLGPVLGGVLGGAAVLAAAVASIMFVMARRRRRRTRQYDTEDGKPDEKGSTVGGQDAPSFGSQSCTHGTGSAVDGEAPGVLGVGCTSSKVTAVMAREVATKGDAGGAGSRTTRADEPDLVIVTQLTPMLRNINLAVKLCSDAERPPSGQEGADVEGGSHAEGDVELKLLPTVLGKGSFGCVVEGLYGGRRVAVKILHKGFGGGLAHEGAAPAAAAAAPEANTAVVTAAVTLPENGRAPPNGGPKDSPAAATVAKEGVAIAAAAAGEAGLPGPAVCAAQAGCGVAQQQQQQQQQQLEEEAGTDQLYTSGEAFMGLAQEVEVLARCQHPNIVRLLAASLRPPHMCLVMELMDTSLDRLLYGRPDRHLMPLQTVLHIGIQVSRALSYLHPTILHRDLKPANVLIQNPLSPEPVAKLADFGLSRLLHTVLVTQNPEAGTAPYMAPEAFDVTNSTITDRADVYAVGVLLWEMLAGQRPWDGYTIVQVAYAVTLVGSRLPLQEIPSDRCPALLRDLITSCWDSVPARRPAAAEIAKTLSLLQTIRCQ